MNGGGGGGGGGCHYHPNFLTPLILTHLTATCSLLYRFFPAKKKGTMKDL